MLKNKLQIILITYNRKKYLQRTFEQIFADNSSIKDFDITILDNASTDGTSELIEEYKLKFPNITHIRHSVNIGGNANICRAFEMGAICGKEYVWILCDDDKYDFSAWDEVEKAIEDRNDVICLADYFFPSDKEKTNPVYQIPQLSFVPAGIYKTELISSDVLMNMYDSILTMFPQTCLIIDVVNKKGSVHVLSESIVFNGLRFEDDKAEDNSYTRGMKEKAVLSQRENTNWILGFVKVTSLLKDKKLRKETIKNSILNEDIYGSWHKFYKRLFNLYFHFGKFQYYYEIYNSLYLTYKLLFFVHLPIIVVENILAFLFSIRNDGKEYKIYTVCGFKFRRKRKPKH